MIKKIRTIGLTLALVLTPVLSQAAVVSIGFTDPQGLTKEKAPEAVYLNPASGMTVAVSSGLNRQIQLQLFLDATEMYGQLSPVIGSENTFSRDGLTHFGHVFDVPAGLAEGDYTLTATILDNEGAVVATEQHSIVLDTTPPSAGAMSWIGDKRFTDPSGWMLSWAFSQQVLVDNVTDGGSGIGDVRIVSFWEDGAEAGTQAGEVAGFFQDAVATTGTRAKNWAPLFPFHQRYYLLRFQIFDRAGNKTDVDQSVSYNYECGDKPELVSVYNPGVTSQYLGAPELTGFEAYTAGMTAYENPVTTLWRLPKTNHVNTTPFGITNFTVDYEDTNFYYFKHTDAHRDVFVSHDSYRFTKYTIWQCGWVEFDLQLDPGVEASPEIIAADILYADGGTYPMATGSSTPILNKSELFQITGFSVQVAPRSYDQSVVLVAAGIPPNSVGCDVPASLADCTIPWIFNPQGDSGEIQFRLQSRDPSSVLVGSLGNHLLRWDFVAPTFLSFNVDEANQESTLHVYDPDTPADYRSLSWRPKAAELRFYQSLGDPLAEYGDLVATLAPVAEPEHPDTPDYLYTFDLNTLPEGDYVVQGYVIDTFDNFREEVLGGYLKDSTGPELTITYSGSPLDGSQIPGMDGIAVFLSDAVDPSPTLNGIYLSGGSILGEIELAYIVGPDGSILPEPPMLFPSEPGTNYSLRVTGIDNQGNQSSQSAAFAYAPPTVSTTDGGPAYLLRSSTALKGESGLWPLTSEPVLDPDGNPALGTYTLQVALDPAASGSLLVDGQVLAPGATISIPGYALSANDDRISIPVALVDPSVDVDAEVMVATGYPNLPVFVATVRSWSPADEITLTPELPTFNTLQDAALLEAIALSGGHCAGRVASDIASTSDFCAVRWNQLPTGMIVDTYWNASSLSGGIASPGDYELIYQPGVMQPEGFAPVGDPVTRTITVTEPAPPVISFASTGTLGNKQGWIPDGEWPANLGDNKLAGYVHINADNYGLAVRILSPDGSEQLLSTALSAISAAVYTNIPDLTGQAVYQVEAWYEDYPPAISSSSLTFSPVPTSPSIRLLYSSRFYNLAPAILSGNLGDYVPETRSYVYDPDVHGQWQVRLRITNRLTGEVLPDTAPVAISASDGSFSIDAGILPEGYYEVLAIGDRIAGAHTAEAAVQSTKLYAYVDDGSPVSATIHVNGSETGSVPFYAKPSVRLEDIRRSADVGSIEWESSTDGVSFTPFSTERALSYGIIDVIEDPETRWYRAKLLNRYSGQSFVTEAVQLQAYRKPIFTLTGYTATFVGNPVTWSATLLTPDPVEFDWVIKDTPRQEDPVLASGPNQDFTASAVGYKYVTLTARPTGAEHIENAATSLTRTLKILPPYLHKPSILAPIYVETGRSYEFRATHQPLITGGVETDLVRKGEWLLPDGTAVPLDQVTYTIQPGDTALTYRTWIEGYEAETEIVIPRTFRTWTYQWPSTWVMKTSLSAAFAPTNLTALVYTDPISDALGMGGLKPDYTFNLPPGMQLLSAFGNRAVLSIAEPGEYPIEALVTDDRGNEAVVYQVVSVPEPPPLEVGLQLFPGDAWNRVPAKVTARMTINNPVLGESMSTHRLYLDGALAYEGRYTVISIEEIEVAGVHTVRSEVEMDTGRNSAAEATVEFVEGVPPDCHLGVVRGDGVSSLEIQTYCTLEQGRIERYRWRYSYEDTGEEVQLGYSGSRISFTSSNLARGVASVTVAVQNDKGQVTEASLVP